MKTFGLALILTIGIMTSAMVGSQSKPTTDDSANPFTPVELRPGVPKTKLMWNAVDVSGQAVENGKTIQRNWTVAGVVLREKVQSIGTTQQRTTSYQIVQLGDDLRSVVKGLDSKVTEGFASMSAGGTARLTVDGEPYAVFMMHRAKPGAQEADFHAVLSVEENPSRVAVYVSGSSATVRHKILRDAEELYSRRPALLDCTGDANLKTSPRFDSCFVR